MSKRDFAIIGLFLVIAAILGPPLISGSVRPLVVLSSSMEPAMSPGDMVIAKETSPNQIERGDIMAFEDPSERPNVLVTHRVIRIEGEGENLVFKTKGDAAEDPDPFVVKSKDVFGKAIFNAPYLGYLFHYGKHPLVFLSLVALPAILITFNEIRKIGEYSDPIKAKKANREEVKNERKEERKNVVYKPLRVAGIFLTGLVIFGALSLPCLRESGYNTEPEFDGGLISTAVVYRESENSIPQYTLISRGENTPTGAVRMSMISKAPHIMPIFWVGALAKIDPILPSLLTFILPPAILTLILYPVWRRPKCRGSPPKNGVDLFKRG